MYHGETRHNAPDDSSTCQDDVVSGDLYDLVQCIFKNVKIVNIFIP